MQFERRRTALLAGAVSVFTCGFAISADPHTPWTLARGVASQRRTISAANHFLWSRALAHRRFRLVGERSRFHRRPGKHFELPRVLFKRHGRRCSGRPRRWQAATTPTTWPSTHSARSAAMSEIVRRKEKRALHHRQNRKYLKRSIAEALLLQEVMTFWQNGQRSHGWIWGQKDRADEWKYLILKKKSIYAFKRYITYNLYSFFFYNYYKKKYFSNRGKLIDVINVSNIFLLA